MKQSIIARVVLMVAVLTAGVSIASSSVLTSFNSYQESREERGGSQDQEKAVKMKDLPAAVQKTVREQSKGAAIRGLAQETEDGKTNYEVELRVNGHNKDVLIDPNGVVVTIEEQVTLASLPPAVKATIQQKAGTGKIGMIEAISEGDAIVAYEAHIRRAGKSMEIKVGPDGQLIPTNK